MNLSGYLLKLLGWSVEIKAPNYDKCLICVAPHTSNLDFFLGKLAYASVGRHAGFLMKDTWFFFPLGYFLKKIGGVPVPRKKKRGSVVAALVERFKESDKLQIAITPEGTRSRTDHWKTGFLQISLQANVPCLLGIIDYADKKIIVNETFIPSDNIESDMRYIKNFYKPYTGKYPEKFTTD